MSGHPFNVRPLTEADLEQVTRIHLDAFPDSAFTRLGAGAVTRYYHWLLMGHHQAYCIGAFADETLAAFCFGGKFHGATSGFLQKNRWYLAGIVIMRPWLAFNSLFRQRFQEGLHGLRIARRVAEIPLEAKRKKKNRFTLLAIATDPKQQGHGAGGELMARSEVFAREHGYAEMSLTVHSRNQRALGFYKHLGWMIEREDGENTLMFKPFETDQSN
jgi:ribosomal protein S18 acetylase RimI-like enzyme